MYLEYRANFWGRRKRCAYVRQTSVPYISGFSLNQDSIPGTDRNLYEPSGRPKCFGTQIPSRREAIRMLLGPYFGEYYYFWPFCEFFLQKNSPCGPLPLFIRKVHSSFQVLNATCDAVIRAHQSQNPEKTRFLTAQIWDFGGQI